PVEPVVAVQFWLLGVLVAGVLGAALSVGFGLFAAIAVAIGGPAALVALRGRARTRAAHEVADLLDRCAMQLRSGGTIGEALAECSPRAGAIGRDMARLADRVALGATLTVALDLWARERDVPGVRATAGALALAVTVGGSCADALDALAESLRSRLA